MQLLFSFFLQMYELINQIGKNEKFWDVESIYEFQFFNCPTCEFKHYSKQDFVNHAFNTHTKSVDYLKKISDGSLSDIVSPWEDLQDDKMAYTYSDLYYSLEEKGIGKKKQRLPSLI